MKQKVSKTKIAGILILLAGLGHILPSLILTWRTWFNILKKGWWNNIPPPWTSSAINLQASFWKVWGSFAIPFILIGIVILWLDKQKLKVPKIFSLLLVTYSLIVITLVPAGGFWIILMAGILLVNDKSGKPA